MGIPKYFRWITNNYDNLIFDKTTIHKIQVEYSDIMNIQNLFLDANGLIHPCVRKILESYPDLIKEHNNQYSKNLNNICEKINIYSKLEKFMFEEIISYIKKLVTYINPTELLYIAIDGVAPRAKMEQQRKRRYRSAKEKKLKSKIYKYFNIIKEEWDTNCITPGTSFMLKLNNYLIKNLQKQKIHTNIIFSGSDVPHEGEHKIMNYLRNLKDDKINCIYGLDADLIMLSLCNTQNIYLLRESIHINNVDTENLLLFSIKNLKENLLTEMKSMIDSEELEIVDDYLITDYVFLCFLLGNDFLPKLINLDIYENNIKDLLSIYVNFLQLKKKYLVTDTVINFKFLQTILTNLFYSENKHLQNIQRKLDERYIRYSSKEPLTKELEKINNYPVLPIHKVTIELGTDNWQDRYYNYYLHINNISKSHEYIDTICFKYIEGLQWNIKYYLQGCPSWTWYFPFPCAPCLRELTKYLDKRIYHSEFQLDKPLLPIEQLLLVIPSSSFELIPNEYKPIMRQPGIVENYPSKYKLYTLNNIWFHECDPILSIYDESTLLKEIQKISLSEFNLLKNKIGKEISIINNKLL